MQENGLHTGRDARGGRPIRFDRSFSHPPRLPTVGPSPRPANFHRAHAWPWVNSTNRGRPSVGLLSITLASPNWPRSGLKCGARRWWSASISPLGHCRCPGDNFTADNFTADIWLINESLIAYPNCTLDITLTYGDVTHFPDTPLPMPGPPPVDPETQPSRQ